MPKAITHPHGVNLLFKYPPHKTHEIIWSSVESAVALAASHPPFLQHYLSILLVNPLRCVACIWIMKINARFSCSLAGLLCAVVFRRPRMPVAAPKKRRWLFCRNGRCWRVSRNHYRRWMTEINPPSNFEVIALWRITIQSDQQE